MGRLLVADDHLAVAEHLRNLLQNMGHEVLIASEAERASQVLGRETFDLCVLDLLFGRQTLSGLDILDTIATLEVQPKVVIWVSSGESRFDYLYVAFADHPNLIHGAYAKTHDSSLLLDCVEELLACGESGPPAVGIDSPFIHESMVMYLPSPVYPNPIDVLLEDQSHSAAIIAIANNCLTYSAISEQTGYKLPTLHHAVKNIAERLEMLHLEEVRGGSAKTCLATVIKYVGRREEFFKNWGRRHPERTRKPT